MLGNRKKSVIIAGCGKLGSSIAGSLSEQGYRVTIIDVDPLAFRKLSPDFSGFQIEGDATSVNVLVDAGIENVDILMATANRDNVNLMISQIASVIFGVKQVYARLYDVEKEQLLKGLNIEAIFPAKLSIQEFQRLSQIEIDED